MDLICNHEKCNKCINLISFTCRCGKVFCIKHKNSQNHSCTYDYKNYSKKKLEKSLIKTVKRKVEEI